MAHDLLLIYIGGALGTALTYLLCLNALDIRGKADWARHHVRELASLPLFWPLMIFMAPFMVAYMMHARARLQPRPRRPGRFATPSDGV